MRSTTAVCCAVAATALLATAGCGGTTHHAAGDRHTAAAPAKGAAKDTGTTPPAGDSAARAALTAAAKLAESKKSADITQTIDLYGKRTSAKGSYTWGTGEARSDTMVDAAKVGFQKLVHTDQIEARQIGTATYYRIDPQPSGPLQGRHWVRIDLSAYLGAAAANTDAGDAAKGDPAVALRRLAASTDLRTVGPATVDGRRTTHYRGHVPASAAMKKQGLVEPPLEDVWLTPDGTLVRVRQDVSSVITTLDFTSFGGVKEIAVPPGWDTADRTDEVAAQRQKALHPSTPGATS